MIWSLILGFVIGAFIGTVLMACLAINKGEDENV